MRRAAGRGLGVSPAAQKPHPGAGHRRRLRERFLEHGLESFTDDQVLELLLTLATPRRDCKEPARELLGRMGSLAAVLDAEPRELAGVKGVGPKNIFGLKLVPAVARRYLETRLVHKGAAYSRHQVADYLRFVMGGLKEETFRVLLLDNRDRVQASEEMGASTHNQALVFPRQVVACALEQGAAAVVCAHNHPSGDPTPSPRDRAFTRRLYFALRGVQVELRDHLVVAGERIHSLAEEGFILELAGQYATLDLE